MGHSHLSIEERFRIVTTGLGSGVSICTWCKENNIPTGTFYSWISQVQKSGYQIDYPIKKYEKHQSCQTKQEVVKVDVIPDNENVIDFDIPTMNSTVQMKHLTLKTGDFILEIPNGTDMTLLAQVINALRCNS